MEALADDMVHVIASLSAELATLRAEHADLREGYLDLIAAARAAVSADHDGEPFAMDYLTDELIAGHGQTGLAAPRWAVEQ